MVIIFPQAQKFWQKTFFSLLNVQEYGEFTKNQNR